MSFELQHTFVAQRFSFTRRTVGDQTFYSVNKTGHFPVLFPGRLILRTSATFVQRIPIPDLNDVDDTQPLHGGFQIVTEEIPLDLRIFTPDGREFTANEITLADLKKFRDLRGSPAGMWSYRLRGASDPIVNEDSIITTPRGAISIGVVETITSESAPPLVNRIALIPGRRVFRFDLFRVGAFVAGISQSFAGARWRGTMRLVDPDGVAVASTTERRLTFNVDLRTLNKSRDAAGKVRPWRLEVSPTGPLQGSPRISANVIESGRITVASLKSRIEALLGKDQQFVHIFGENKNGQALARLKITNEVSAESIDMHNLLEKALERVEQDPGVNPKDIKVDQVYTIGRTSGTFKVSVSIGGEEIVGALLELNCSEVRVDKIDVAIGPSVMLEGAIPAVKLTVPVSGAIKIQFNDLTLAEAKVRGGKFEMEIGIKLDPNGTPQIVTALPNAPFDIDVSNAAIALFLVTFPALGAVIVQRVESKESDINKAVIDSVKNLFSDTTIAPRILMTIFGAHLTYKSIHFEGEDIVFQYVAPVEPEFKPSPNYQGAIGRGIDGQKENGVIFSPLRLGDTWRADNLNKIDHIVVVMMENRSYDHVLGYRALARIGETADGLTSDLIGKINTAPKGPFNVRQLREAGFEKNAAGMMTRIPKSVGHDTHDVQQQLSVRATGPNERSINSPEGFVENFKLRLKTDPRGVVPDDVLGFYDEKDLAFFDFLATHYAYCDRYYCSHPGPTQPNRMYSLTGDLQRDRYGFPILDNNNGDNFLLSRVPTICDLLVRKGLSFRIYESQPSVTMLRMFARYATDNVNIAPLDKLKDDVKRGGRGLPAFTMIEPQMHAHPPDDDHPDADMLRGQKFLWEVYKALTSNDDLWAKTLLIITYDEHGGLYDHVTPPLADIYNLQMETAQGNGGNGTTTPDLVKRLSIPYGVRVPTFVVSPWTMRGKGPSLTLDHCSILKTVLARFFGAEKPFMSDRVNASHSFNAFLTEAAPRMDVPAPPSVPSLTPDVRNTPSATSSIVTKPLSRQEMREGSVDFHSLTGRWARQLGR
jgi:phospholipase C